MTVRIGNGCGFWGDNLDAPVELVSRAHLDYLTLEYLAELTMSILAVQRHKDPHAGYATDFLGVLERLAPHLLARPNLKIVTNAGGMNPAGPGTMIRSFSAGRLWVTIRLMPLRRARRSLSCPCQDT